jgi:hypothetical protein
MPILIVTTTVINDVTCYTRTSSRVFGRYLPLLFLFFFLFFFFFFFFFFFCDESRGEVQMRQSRSRSSAYAHLTTAPYSALQRVATWPSHHESRGALHVCVYHVPTCIMYVRTRVSGRVRARCQIANAADYNLACERCVNICLPSCPCFFLLFFPSNTFHAAEYAYRSDVDITVNTWHIDRDID